MKKNHITVDNHEQIKGDTIKISGFGRFPKKLIIMELGHNKEYRIIKTRKGKYQLVK